MKTRILLADDHAVVRRGLRLVLDAEPDLDVVVETGDGAEAVERALSDEIDLAIRAQQAATGAPLQVEADQDQDEPEPEEMLDE